jgi:hypothetical protein
MPLLSPMPKINIPQSKLAPFGAKWKQNGGSLKRTPPYSSSELGGLFDDAIGDALAKMLGSISVVKPNSTSLTPPQPNCVEVGPMRVIGGVRPQNFDVGYRPDGVRFAHDTKTLNDTKSVMKNWQNMVNDISTEATTVHSRFPHALVTFVVAIPKPCAAKVQLSAITETLERLAKRVNVNNGLYMAEAIALVLWDPATGNIDSHAPEPSSPLRIEGFSKQVEQIYWNRYKGLPPHARE